MTAPTGLEHVTKTRIKATSATERAGFRKCRRQWWLTVAHRLGTDDININFFLGNLYHAALEQYYTAQMAGETHEIRAEEALDRYQDEFSAAVEAAKVGNGLIWNELEPALREAGELGWGMLEGYLDNESQYPLFDEVIAVEQRINVPIIRPGAKRRSGVLSVQPDAVGYRDGVLTVADHKTASSYVPSAHLDIDDQLSAEVYAVWKGTGDFPHQAVYNVSLKKLPQKPALLKSGKLSKAKAQLTTEALYREAIEENGLDIADYVDILAEIAEKEASGELRFFRREEVFRTPQQMAQFEQNLWHEFFDMRTIGKKPELAYPNPTSMNCGRCPVRAVCTTMMDDGDVEAIIKAGYVVKDPRYSV